MKLSKNMLTAILAILLGAVYLFSTLNLKVKGTGDLLGPKVFPLIVAILIIGLGILLLIKEFSTPEEKRSLLSFQLTSEGKKVLLRIAITCLLGIVYGFILDSLGYLISTTIFMIGLMFLINSLARWKQNILVAVGFSLISYISFATLLHLSLPRGILSF